MFTERICSRAVLLLTCCVTGLCQAADPGPLPLRNEPLTSEPARVAPGYVHVRDGHLYRDDGSGEQRVRLWGANTVGLYRRWGKEEQIRNLDRIAAFGFNAIRMHLFDHDVIAEDDLGYNLKSYEHGDGSYVDMIDHFIAAAAQRGIGVYMTFDRASRALRPEAYDDLLPPDEDEQQWKEAVEKDGGGIESFFWIDRRVEEAYTRYIRNLLAHRNLYTGRTYAEEPGIVLWEICNESSSVSTVFRGLLDNSHPYWKRTLQKQWNRVLREHYGGDAALRAAWGAAALGPRESLDAGTVEPGPTKLYWNAPIPGEELCRVRDFRTFLLNQYLASHQRLFKAIREAAPAPDVGSAVVPVTINTVFEPSLLDLFAASRGDFTCAGTYKWLRSYDPSDKNYPFASMTQDPPSLYMMDMARVTDKPIVTYEINIHKPAPYRAEFPFFVTAFTSGQDWDGVFWYHWRESQMTDPKTSDDLANMQLQYAHGDENGFWAGITMNQDEILLSALKLAGQMFKQGAIRSAPNPLDVRVGADALLDSPSKISQWHTELGIASYTRGMRIGFDACGTGVTSGGKLPHEWPMGSATLGPDVQFLYSRDQLLIDAPAACAWIGWPTASERTFENRVRVSGLTPGKFVAFALCSEDGLPLAQSNRLLLMLLSTGENTGFAYDPTRDKAHTFEAFLRGLVSQGRAPVRVERPTGRVTLLRRDPATASLYDALPQVIAEQPVAGEFAFDGLHPTCWVRISYER